MKRTRALVKVGLVAIALLACGSSDAPSWSATPDGSANEGTDAADGRKLTDARSPDASADVGWLDAPAGLPIGPPSGWCWENPLPQGNSLAALRASARDDVWTVGERGTILHFDGMAWTAVPSGTGNDLHAAWVGGGEVWAAGSSGIILRRTGTTFQSIASPTIDQLLAFDGSGPDDLFAVGENGVALHWDGTAWSMTTSGATRSLRGVWSAAHGEAWAVGDGGALLHFVSGAWTRTPFDATVDFGAVWGSGPNDVWAFGGTRVFEQGVASVVAHFDGRAWSESMHGGRPLVSAWGSSATDIWAVTGPGPGAAAVAHWDGRSWTSTVLGPDDIGSAIGGSGPNAIWIVGSDGLMVHFDGASWTHHSTRVTSDDLWGIGGTGESDIWAVGVSGTVLHYDGTTWSSVPSPTTASIGAVFGTAPHDAWAIVPFGGRESILHWDGLSWSVALSGQINLYSGWAATPDDAWAVGADRVMHWDGRAWGDAMFDPSLHFTDIWGTARDNVWAIGAIDISNNPPLAMVTHWDGVAWKRAAIPAISGGLGRIWGSAPDDVWVGVSSILDSGALLHFDGASWSSVATGANIGLYAVGGGARDDVWAFAGNQDPLLHFEGTAWSAQRLPTHPVLSALWASGRQKGRLVGDKGVILRRCP